MLVPKIEAKGFYGHNGIFCGLRFKSTRPEIEDIIILFNSTT